MRSICSTACNLTEVYCQESKSRLNWEYWGFEDLEYSLGSKEREHVCACTCVYLCAREQWVEEEMNEPNGLCSSFPGTWTQNTDFIQAQVIL
jgi:hypothetical protein